ncbi:MAG: iron ABC transporter permease [Clostridiales bacterium]|nr:iron ABC transporter permease [Clostridiales bacterium]
MLLSAFLDSSHAATCHRVRGRRGVLPVLFFLLLLLLLFSFAWGRYDVPLAQVPRILLSRLLPIPCTWTSAMEASVLHIRLPRILLACLVGGALSLAGAAYQSVFHNPMAAPDILGASSGACFGAALAILLELGRSGTVLTAFAFSLLSVALVYLAGSRCRGSRVIGILLAGVMVSSLFSAGTSWIKLLADPGEKLPAITYWLMGSLAGARTSELGFAAAAMAPGALPLLLLGWRINLLTLREEEARSMGVHTGRLRLAVILCATLLTAASVSVSGMIGWVGLVVPNLSRKLSGNNCRDLFPTVLVLGALFLLLTDDLSRNLMATEIPIGILTAFVGVPFFLLIMAGKDCAS